MQKFEIFSSSENDIAFEYARKIKDIKYKMDELMSKQLNEPIQSFGNKMQSLISEYEMVSNQLMEDEPEQIISDVKDMLNDKNYYNGVECRFELKEINKFKEMNEFLEKLLGKR